MAVVLVLSAASMAGLPLEAGFIAKEEAYAGLRQAGSPEIAVLVGVVVGSSLHRRPAPAWCGACW